MDRNIKEQERAPEALPENERRHRELFESIGQGAFRLRADGTVADINAAALEIFGLSREEILAGNPDQEQWRIFREDGFPFPTAEYPSRVALRTGKPVSNVVAGVQDAKLQDFRWVVVNATPEFRVGDTAPYQVFVTLDEIPGQRRAELALRKREDPYRSLFERSSEGILVSGAQTREILDVNGAFCRLSGYERRELVGRPETVLHASGRWNLAPSSAVQTFDAACSRSWQTFELLTKSGAVKPVEVNTSTLEIGGCMVLQHLFRDISQESRYRSERETTARLLRLLNTGGDKHELISDLTKLIREWTGCAAVSIELACEPPNQANRPAGCFCNALLDSRNEAGLPLFTLKGSIWTDRASESREDGLPFRVCNQRTGSESIALVPLRHGRETIGLLCIHDPNRGRLSSDSVEFLEAAAGQIAMALAQLRLQAELRTSQQRFRDVIGAAGEFMWEVDCHARITYVSQRVEAVTGYSAVELAGRKLMHFLEVGDVRRMRGLLATCFRRKKGFRELEFRLPSKSGSQLWLTGTAVPILSEDSRMIGLRGVTADVTAQRTTEAALRDSEQRYRDISLHIADAIFELDPSHRITYVSERVRDLVGFGPEELLGHSPGRFYELAGLSDIWENGLPMLASREAFRDYPVDFVSKDGRKVNLEISVVPRTGPSGVFLGHRGVIRDATARKRAERERAQMAEQLQQTQKLESLGRLAGGIAHDFNNLLTVINGYSEILVKGTNPLDPLHSGLEEIRRAGERAKALTAQLLAFSRKQVLTPQVLELDEVLRGIERMMDRLLGEDIDLTMHLGCGQASVRADPHQLEQVIVNLGANARDAMPRGGRLTIETACVQLPETVAPAAPDAIPGAWVQIRVTDTGSGMTDEVRQRLFEPFFTTKQRGKGTGLGLSTAHGIIAQSDGQIEVDSAPGRGTTFRILLPRVRPEAAVAPVQQPSRASVNGRETILVVEDQGDVRNFTAAALRSYGYRVLKAASGAEALEICESAAGGIELVLTDVVMPAMSGRELADRLRQRFPAIRVLCMTGYTDDVMVRHGVRAGAIAIIEKPFTPEALAAKIREVIHSHLARPRVLIADDESSVRALLRTLLEQAGYEIIEAENGNEAISHALASPVDLLITDLVMPEKEGIETILSLRKQQPGLKILAISGAMGGQFLNLASALGADVVMPKPLSPALLISQVRELLAVRR